MPEINGTLTRGTPAKLASSVDIQGSQIFAANLAALQNYNDLAVLSVGQLGYSQDSGLTYQFTVIGNPPSIPHTLVQFGGGSISGTLTSGKIPVATGANTIGDSALTQATGNVSCSGQLTATNLSGTNTGDQDLTNMPTTDEKAAMDNANNPSASNPFLTSNDGINAKAINQVIGQLYNGKDQFYLDSTVIRGVTSGNTNILQSLTTVPSGLTEQSVDILVSGAASPVPVFSRVFLNQNLNMNYYGLYEGVTTGKIWAAVTNISYNTEILQNIMQVRAGTGTVTITGSGTSRIATATSSVFLSSDDSTDPSVSSWLYTPTGVYQIFGYSSGTTVAIQTLSTYVNETNVTYSIIRKVYQVTTGPIYNTTVNELTFFSPPQQQFSPFNSIDWNPKDQIAIVLLGKTSAPIGNTIKITYTFCGQSRYSHLDLPGLIQIKSISRSIEPSVTYGATRRSRAISGTGSFNFDFTVPEDFKKLLSAHMICYPSVGAAGAGRIISTLVEYNNYYGDAYNAFAASELNVVYDLTNFANKRFHLPFTNNLSSIVAGGEGGVTVNHVAASGTIDYTALQIIYI